VKRKLHPPVEALILARGTGRRSKQLEKQLGETQKLNIGIDLTKISSSDLAREMARRARPAQAARRILKPCKFCQLPFAVREMRAHLHLCTMKTDLRRRKGSVTNGE
jgi:hypothetical protein